jgi:hypothetical protein
VGTATAMALYIGAVAVVRHDGKNLPPYPTAAAHLTAVALGGKVPLDPHPAPDRWR